MRFKLGRASGDPELRDVQHNYLLNPVNTFSLFDEFMEMSTRGGRGHRPHRLQVLGQEAAGTGGGNSGEWGACREG